MPSKGDFAVVSDERAQPVRAESRTKPEPPVGTTPFPAVNPGTVLAGRYEVIEPIGRGGMGSVLKAHDRTLGEMVAIKIVRDELGGGRQWAERLAREVKLARAIHHPNVCRVFDFEQADGRVFLVMELAARSLRDELDAGTATERGLEARLADARAIALGLSAIHSAGIVHRDVAPQNVLRMRDGRLVVSDFGLATDSLESTTNLGGGTIAYMAPELLRGGRASVASDVWALGAVIHEVVFGLRPAWGTELRGEMLEPALPRRLSRVEQRVLEVCRACMSFDPRKRVGCAAEVALQLGTDRLARATRHRRLAVGSLILGASALAVAGSRVAPWLPSLRRATTSDAAIIAPTGVPADWTRVATVLADIPDEVRCMTRLPDRRTIRFVWGHPARAEDVDTHTRQRSPSPIVPAAYAEGCPDVSVTGKLVYSGHTADNRAFAFVSDHADGRDAVPMVQIAEPSMMSDPEWLPDGSGFVYEADVKFLAVFSLSTRRSSIVPNASGQRLLNFHRLVSSQIFLLTNNVNDLADYSSDVVGIDWNALSKRLELRIPGAATDIEQRSEASFYVPTLYFDAQSPILEVDATRRAAINLGIIQGQQVRRLRAVQDGLALLSARSTSPVSSVAANGSTRVLTKTGFFIDATACGPSILATLARGSETRVVSLDWQGNLLGQFAQGPHNVAAACTADGTVKFYTAFDRADGYPHGPIFRCDATGCRSIGGDVSGGLSLSPDGKRLAYIGVDTRGPVVRWIPAAGGEVHDVGETETFCAPSWSSDRTVWISRRRGPAVVWTEIDADTTVATGRERKGDADCTSGNDDRGSPARQSVKVQREIRSQIRLLPRAFLAD
jgi:protein kinase-like protein